MRNAGGAVDIVVREEREELILRRGVVLISKDDGLAAYQEELSRKPGIEEAIEFLFVSDLRQALDVITDAEVLVCSPSLFTCELFQVARGLRWIHSNAHGVEQILIPEVVNGPVQVTSSKGVFTTPVSEHAIAMILALSRGLVSFMSMKHRRAWVEGVELREVAGKVLGVIGLGSIGKAIACKAQCLGMKTVGVKRDPLHKPACVDKVWGPDEKDELLRVADFVVLATPNTPETAGMIGSHELTVMKDSAFLINISRGAMVQENALAAALRTGQVAGAALDVFETQPLPAQSPLWDMPNLLITPYVAYSSPEAIERGMELLIENVERYLSGTPLKNIVDKSKGY